MEQELADSVWDEDAFNAWAEVEQQAARLVEMSDQMRFWY